jgi:hypothetical protein
MIVRSWSLGMQRTVEACAAGSADIPGGKAQVPPPFADGRSMHPLSPHLGGDETLQSALASLPDLSVIVLDTEMQIRALHGTALRRHGYVHDRMVGRRCAG